MYLQVHAGEAGEPHNVKIRINFKKKCKFHTHTVRLLKWLKKKCAQYSKNNENLSAPQWQQTVLTNRKKTKNTERRITLWGCEISHLWFDNTWVFSVVVRSGKLTGSKRGGGWAARVWGGGHHSIGSQSWHCSILEDVGTCVKGSLCLLLPRRHTEGDALLDYGLLVQKIPF